MQSRVSKFIVFVRVVGELLFLYGILGWAYGMLVQVTYPEWLMLPLSHLTQWLRVDTFAIASFILSAIGFFLWRMTKETTRSAQK